MFDVKFSAIIIFTLIGIFIQWGLVNAYPQ